MTPAIDAAAKVLNGPAGENLIEETLVTEMASANVEHSAGAEFARKLPWGQKLGTANDCTLPPAPSALGANSCPDTPFAFEGNPIITFERIDPNVFAYSQVIKMCESFPGDEWTGVAA